MMRHTSLSRTRSHTAVRSLQKENLNQMKIYSFIIEDLNITFPFFVTIKDGLLHRVIHQDYVIGGERMYFSDLINLNHTLQNENEILSIIKSNKELSINFSEKALKVLELRKLENSFGDFYPRIYRPFFQYSNVKFSVQDKLNWLEGLIHEEIAYDPNLNKGIVNSINQLNILTENLKEIFDIVRPVESNLNVYGDKIKNLLVLACVEVESQFKLILAANNYARKKNYSTKDYIKLKKILKLENYYVSLPFYPEFRSFSPFEHWDSQVGATKSLDWYNSYNAVKHNSEEEINRATLEMALQAISAFAILIVAQFGNSPMYWKERIGNYFHVSNNTIWSYKDYIFAPLAHENWNENKINI
jgi:hypothetical protein